MFKSSSSSHITVVDYMRPKMSDAPLRHRLMFAVSWSVMGTGASQILFLIASIMTARLLDLNDFGRLGLLQSTLNTLVAFIAPSFGLSLMRIVATLRDTEPHLMSEQVSAVFQVGLLISLVLTFSLLALAPWLCEQWFNGSVTQRSLQIAAFSLVANGIFSMQISVLAGFEAFRESAFLNTLKGILLVIWMVGGAYWGGLTGAVFGLTVSSYLSALLGAWIMLGVLRRRNLRLTRCSWRSGSDVLRDVSLPSFLSTVITSLVMWLGSVLLTRLPNGLAQVALFTAANHWRTVLLFLPTQINQSTAPILANLWMHAELQRFRLLVHTNLLLNLVTAGITCLILAFAAKPILHLYQLGSASDAFSLRLFAFSGVIAALCGVLGYTMAAIGRLWEGLIVNALWAAVFIVLSLAFLSRGAVGLSISYTVSYITLFVISFFYVVLSIQRAALMEGN